MKAPVPPKTDPERALAAFKFGVYSRDIGVDLLPEAMASRHSLPELKRPRGRPPKKRG